MFRFLRRSLFELYDYDLDVLAFWAFESASVVTWLSSH
jgi:hypothetical protein